MNQENIYLEYDDIANEQRKVIYNFRNQLLDESFDIDDRIKDNRANISKTF